MTLTEMLLNYVRSEVAERGRDEVAEELDCHPITLWRQLVGDSEPSAALINAIWEHGGRDAVFAASE